MYCLKILLRYRHDGQEGKAMYYVLSGDKGKRPTIIQAFKTEKAAKKAAEKRRKAWGEVTIKFLQDVSNIVDVLF